MTPVFFGIVLRDFRVGHLLAGPARLAPSPWPRPADTRAVVPAETSLTGFVFKVQGKMGPNQRDCVASLRACSGRVQKGTRLTQVRAGQHIPVNAPLFFVAKERRVAEQALPGDVVGIAKHGTLHIGATQTTTGRWW
jgi:peptide chain release factor 3